MIKGKFHEESSNIAAYVRFTEVEMTVKATAFNCSLVIINTHNRWRWR